jgi:two-component system cell cycle sensor histidine kinase/response regulator CckA
VASDADTARAQEKRLLGRGFEVTVPSTEEDMWAAVRRGGIALIVVNNGLPGGKSGLDVYRGLKAAGHDLPVLLVTELTSEASIIEALREGVRDFVPRSLEYLDYLPDAVDRVLRQIRLEEELLESRLKLSSFVESTLDGVITVEADLRISLFNPAAEAIFRCPAAEATGRSLIDFLPDGLPSSETARPAPVEGQARSRSLRTYASGVRSDGARLDLELSVIFVELVPLAFFTLIVRDVTDALRAERRTAAQHEITRLLAESSSLTEITPTVIRILVEELGWEVGAIWRIDTVANLLRCVDVWCKADEPLSTFAMKSRQLTLAPGVDLPGQVWAEPRTVMTLDVRDRLDSPRRELFVAAGLCSGLGVPISGGDDPLGVIEFYGCSSEPPDAAFLAMLESLSIQISQLIERRQVEEQLLQSQKLEAVGRLAGGIAHDFNNLLTVITGHTALVLDETSASDPNRAALTEVLASAAQAAALTKQLLGFSRKQMLRLTTLDLQAIVEEQVAPLERLLGEKIQLVTRFHPPLGRVRADATQIEQILLHLSENAKDAMPDGGTFTIELTNVVLDEAHAREIVGASPGDYVMLAVADTGRGMDPVTQKRIFEPYFTTKPLGRGTGLGLAMVYGAIKQTGGHIWVYSEPGKGTIFKTYFPRVEGPGSPAPSPRPTTPPDDLRGDEMLLLVEDEDRLRTFAARLLKNFGYRVIEAENGAVALALFKKHIDEIDLVVSDIVMPVMDGIKLRAALRAVDPDVLIIFMSGYMEDTVVQQGLLEPGTFVSKPFSAPELLGKIRSVLAPSCSPAAAPSSAPRTPRASRRPSRP